MRGGRSTDEQIIGVLREAGTGASTGDLCRRFPGEQVTHHSRTARGLADTGQVVRRTAPF